MSFPLDMLKGGAKGGGGGGKRLGGRFFRMEGRGLQSRRNHAMSRPSKNLRWADSLVLS